MKIYVYRVFETKDKYSGSQLIKEGILDYAEDVLIDDIFPEFNTTADCSLWDMQIWLNKNYPDKKYHFQYKEKEVDYNTDFTPILKETNRFGNALPGIGSGRLVPAGTVIALTLGAMESEQEQRMRILMDVMDFFDIKVSDMQTKIDNEDAWSDTSKPYTGKKKYSWEE